MNIATLTLHQKGLSHESIEAAESLEGWIPYLDARCIQTS